MIKCKSKDRSLLFFIVNTIVPLCYSASIFSQTNSIRVYLLNFVLCVLYLWPVIKEKGLLFIFSPTILSVIYISLNCIIGGIYMREGLILDSDLLDTFNAIPSKHLWGCTFITTVFNSVLCIIGVKSSRRFNPNSGVQIEEEQVKRSSRIKNIIVLSIILFSLASIPIAFHETRSIGFVQSLYFPFYLGTLICMFYNFLQLKCSNLMNWLVTIGLFIITAILLYHSKREAFFCLIAMMIMLFLNGGNYTLKIKHLLLGGILGVLSIVLVLTASLMRGYNNFDGDSYVEALKCVPQYVESPTFWAATGSNFEVVSAYPHTVNSFSYIFSGRIPVLYGESFWKVFFVPIPESVFNYKPRKMLEVYTETYDIAFRNIGGSYPVMCYADFVANFSIFSILIVILFFSVCDQLYYSACLKWKNNKRVVKKLTTIAFAAIVILFTRGDGFSSLCLYTFLAWCAICMIRKFHFV